MFIDNHRHRFSVVKMALRLGVSVSSYSDYCKCRYLKRETKKVLLSQKIRDCFYDCRQLYGSRLAVELITDHCRLSQTIVAKYMRQMGLRSKFYHKYRTTTDSKHSNMEADNLLDRNFSAKAPNQAWVSDITYVSVIGGFEYPDLEDLFEIYRDNTKIRQMNKDGENYKRTVKEKATLDEQARLRQQEAEKLNYETEKLRAK